MGTRHSNNETAGKRENAVGEVNLYAEMKKQLKEVVAKHKILNSKRKHLV